MTFPIPSGTLIVTGAAGFVGSHVVDAARARGWRVEAWSRRRPAALAEGVAWQAYDLDSDLPELPADLAAVIHCAHDMSGSSPAIFDRNVNAARRLRAAALAVPGARFVFLSSQSAHPAALSFYGRSKRAIEQLMDSPRDLTIRSGFVIGGGGIYARIRESLAKLPATPLFYGGRQPLHTVWFDDLVEILLLGAERNLSGEWTVGVSPAVALRDFYAMILAADGLKKPLIPIPGGPAMVGLRLAERLGLKLPVTSENLLGLKALIPFDEEIARAPLPYRYVPTAEAVARAKAGDA